MTDNRTPLQYWTDVIAEFSGSVRFVFILVVICVLWVFINVFIGDDALRFDPYPFLFLNWFLTIVNTFQSPLILAFQYRQSENSKAKTDEILAKLDELQQAVRDLKVNK